jgi:hypothetical protein
MTGLNARSAPGEVCRRTAARAHAGASRAAARQQAPSPDSFSRWSQTPFGIASSWQLVGARDLGLTSTVTAAINRPASRARAAEPADQDGEPPAHPSGMIDE